MSKSYETFLRAKLPMPAAAGVEPTPIHPLLFDFQSAITQWAIRRGRAAVFADCGMGKSLIQLEWARQSGNRVLLLAPLAVAEQTIREGQKIGVEVQWCSEPITEDGIWITNYQKLHKFIGAEYDAIVLDESSILKSLDGKTRTMLIKEFTHIPHRLCCTATPAPNDIAELANHAEFLGVMPRNEMLAHFFVHDSDSGAGTGGWRLKGHARDVFWKWIAEWACFIRKPSDLGYDDGQFILPELVISEEQVRCDYRPEGELFPRLTKGVGGRTESRRASMDARIERAVEIVQASDEQWLIWCGLNDEGQRIAKMLGASCREIAGSTPEENKIAFESEWRGGKVKTLVSKVGIFGYGLNWQHCRNVLYLGIGDSFEQFYQSVRRCWRFGQERPVNAVIVTSDAEVEVVENIKRKERTADDLARGIIEHIRIHEIAAIKGGSKAMQDYEEKDASGMDWRVMLGDSVERIREIETGSVALSVFSPPFASLYTYSASERDLGNSKDYDEFFRHFGYLIPELLRATMPGRRACVHVQQVATLLSRDGVIGWRDYRADVVKAFVMGGWVYDGEVVIDKDPQAQAIRTKSKALMFVQKNKDSAWSRPAMADYILLFRAPGENAIPVKTDVNNEEWIRWARPIWYDIRESNTLNAAVARENNDERHICPLQLETIERCIRLWSNRGELICDPFAGIGSTGVVALQHDRRFIGCELKPSYWKTAVRNLTNVAKQTNLFAAVGAD